MSTCLPTLYKSVTKQKLFLTARQKCRRGEKEKKNLACNWRQVERCSCFEILLLVKCLWNIFHKWVMQLGQQLWSFSSPVIYSLLLVCFSLRGPCENVMGRRLWMSTPDSPCPIAWSQNRWLIRRSECMSGPEHPLFCHLWSILFFIPGRKRTRRGSEDHSLVRLLPAFCYVTLDPSVELFGPSWAGNVNSCLSHLLAGRWSQVRKVWKASSSWKGLSLLPEWGYCFLKQVMSRSSLGLEKTITHDTFLPSWSLPKLRIIPFAQYSGWRRF